MISDKKNDKWERKEEHLVHVDKKEEEHLVNVETEEIKERVSSQKEKKERQKIENPILTAARQTKLCLRLWFWASLPSSPPSENLLWYFSSPLLCLSAFFFLLLMSTSYYASTEIPNPWDVLLLLLHHHHQPLLNVWYHNLWKSWRRSSCKKRYPLLRPCQGKWSDCTRQDTSHGVS